MNLWAKSLGRLAVFAVALFFFSCEEENSFLGFKKDPKFNVTSVDLPLSTSVFSLDSIITDNKSASNNLLSSSNILLGHYADPALGQVRSEAFVQIFPSGTVLIPADAAYDSVTVQFRLNFYGYGFSGTRTQTFGIHEITGDSLSYYSSKRYWTSDEFQYDPDALAEASVAVNYDSLKKENSLSSTSPDTLVATALLPEEFGRRIFELAKTEDYNEIANRKKFFHTIKGLALIPHDMEGVIGIAVLNGLSRLTIHYRTFEDNVVKDTLARTYAFDHASFSHVTTDRSGSELAGLTQPYQSIVPQSDSRYVQSGSAVVSKIDLTKFYEFADQDSNQNIVINEAQLIIDGVEAPAGLDPHSSLVLKVVNNENDLFANERVTADREALAFYYLVPSGHFFARSDEPTGPNQQPFAQLRYNAQDTRYVAYLTPFLQNLFRYRDNGDVANANRLKYLALYPYTPSVFTSVTRTVFSDNNIRLRIKYTRPSGLNP